MDSKNPLVNPSIKSTFSDNTEEDLSGINSKNPNSHSASSAEFPTSDRDILDSGSLTISETGVDHKERPPNKHILEDSNSSASISLFAFSPSHAVKFLVQSSSDSPPKASPSNIDSVIEEHSLVKDSQTNFKQNKTFSPLPDFKDEALRKKRIRTTSEQVFALQSIFNDNPMPSAAARESLAKELSMSPRAVQVWFQNRRAKDKTDTKKSSVEASNFGHSKSSLSSKTNFHGSGEHDSKHPQKSFGSGFSNNIDGHTRHHYAYPSRKLNTEAYKSPPHAESFHLASSPYLPESAHYFSHHIPKKEREMFQSPGTRFAQQNFQESLSLYSSQIPQIANYMQSRSEPSSPRVFSTGQTFNNAHLTISKDFPQPSPFYSPPNTNRYNKPIAHSFAYTEIERPKISGLFDHDYGSCSKNLLGQPQASGRFELEEPIHGGNPYIDPSSLLHSSNSKHLYHFAQKNHGTQNYFKPNYPGFDSNPSSPCGDYMQDFERAHIPMYRSYNYPRAASSNGRGDKIDLSYSNTSSPLVSPRAISSIAAAAATNNGSEELDDINKKNSMFVHHHPYQRSPKIQSPTSYNDFDCRASNKNIIVQKNNEIFSEPVSSGSPYYYYPPLSIQQQKQYPEKFEKSHRGPLIDSTLPTRDSNVQNLSLLFQNYKSSQYKNPYELPEISSSYDPTRKVLSFNEPHIPSTSETTNASSSGGGDNKAPAWDANSGQILDHYSTNNRKLDERL